MRYSIILMAEKQRLEPLHWKRFLSLELMGHAIRVPGKNPCSFSVPGKNPWGTFKSKGKGVEM
jgi:hypothetical protein